VSHLQVKTKNWKVNKQNSFRGIMNIDLTASIVNNNNISNSNNDDDDEDDDNNKNNNIDNNAGKLSN
jgi:hypothetical protein